MSLLQYIQGVRKGQEAHHLEREAMHNPFLADALEGYDKVKGNHVPQIKALQRKVSKKSHSKLNRHLYYWSMAASILILVSIGSYFLFHQPDLHNEPVLAQQPAIMEMDLQDSQAEMQVSDALFADESAKLSTNSVSEISIIQEKFDDYVKRALIRPIDEECKDVKGNVTLCFYVDANGRPYDITVKKSLCPSADKEAIRLVEESPDWALTDKEVTREISF
ncbi:hypothetical protein FACS189437_06580 [Bacteroidia bacterium]|nr:hypothetical protein FACS189437_06580 [Bacteroidia bacterium]